MAIVKNHVLSIIRNEDEVFVHADLTGLDLLIDRLQQIRRKVAGGECEHDHLMTAAWGDGALTETVGPERDASVVVHHMKLYGWTEEWAIKHQLRQ